MNKLDRFVMLFSFLVVLAVHAALLGILYACGRDGAPVGQPTAVPTLAATPTATAEPTGTPEPERTKKPKKDKGGNQ